MSDINQASKNEIPSIDMLKELYSHQERECWLCKEYAKKLEAGKELKEEELWHFTNCVMAWEEINRQSQNIQTSELQLDKAA